MKKENPPLYAYELQNLKGIVYYRSDISHPSHQEHLRRLQAGRPAATLFTFASLQALIKTYGSKTTVQEALLREAGKLPEPSPEG